MADDDLDFDLDDFPEGGGGGGDAARGPGGPSAGTGEGRRSRWWLWLVLGVALGVAAALLVPRYVTPHLPPSLGGGLVTVQGEVLDKQRESGRLLLTLDSDRGAMLATFRDRISELDLLVGSGDRVTLAMAEFRPFVDDPRLVGVRKGEWQGRVPRSDGDAEDAADESVTDTVGDADADTAGDGGAEPAPDTAEDADGDREAPPPDTAGDADSGSDGPGGDGDGAEDGSARP